MSAVAEPDSTHVDAPDGLLGDLGIGTDDFGEEAADGASEKEGGARGFANAMSQILSKTIPKTKSKVRHSVVSELHVYVCVCVCVCVWPGRGFCIAAARVRNSTYTRVGVCASELHRRVVWSSTVYDGAWLLWCCAGR